MLHSKQWHYSLHRDFQNCYSTRRSPTGFFSSNSTRVPTSIHIQPMCTLHHTLPENSPSRIQFYMQKTKSSLSTTTTTSRGQRDLHSRIQKRNSTHRRQGDLLEVHPCVPKTLQAFQPQGIPVFPDIPVFPVFPDIPVVPDTPETFRTFQSFMTFQPFQAILQFYKVPSIPRESNPLQHSPTRMHILQFSTDSTVRLVSTENSTEYQLGNYKHFYKHYILQRKGDVVISVKRASVKMSK